MEWTKQLVKQLTYLYEQETVLWNVTSANYKNSNVRSDAFQRIAETFDTTAEEVERKLHTLRSQYLRERVKIEKSKKSGAGAEVVYVPNGNIIHYSTSCHHRFLNVLNTLVHFIR